MYLKLLASLVCVALVLGLCSCSSSTEPATSTVEYVYSTVSPGGSRQPAPPGGKVVVRQKVLRNPTTKPTQTPPYSEAMKSELLSLYQDPVDSEDGQKIGFIFLVVMGVFIGLLVLSDIPTLIMHIKNFARKNVAYRCSSKKSYSKDKVVPINNPPPPTQQHAHATRRSQQGVTMVNQQNRQNPGAATVTSRQQQGNQQQQPDSRGRPAAAPVMAAAVVAAPDRAPDHKQHDPWSNSKPDNPPAWSEKAPSPGTEKGKLKAMQMDDDPPPYPGSPLPMAMLPPRRQPPGARRQPFWDPDSGLGPDGRPLQNDGLGAIPRPASPSADGPWGY